MSEKDRGERGRPEGEPELDVVESVLGLDVSVQSWRKKVQRHIEAEMWDHRRVSSVIKCSCLTKARTVMIPTRDSETVSTTAGPVFEAKTCEGVMKQAGSLVRKLGINLEQLGCAEVVFHPNHEEDEEDGENDGEVGKGDRDQNDCRSG
jgi:hypothetical protein